MLGRMKRLLRRIIEALIHRITSIPDDWLVLASATIPIFMIGLIAFAAGSNLADKYAHVAMITLSLVPALLMANVAIFLILLFKPDDEVSDDSS